MSVRSRNVLLMCATTFCMLLMFWTVLAKIALHAQAPAKGEGWIATACSDFKLETTAESNVECGYVTVPLRQAEPDGPTIQLAVVILPSSEEDRQPDPLFMAQGGPGGSTIDTYADFLLQSPEARPTTNRDIVLWDQRGTLYSKPALLCPEVSQAELQDALVDSQVVSGENGMGPYQVCGDRLAAEVGDLSAFNSSENAGDIENLRAALGYDAINFYGVSYGTELGQFVMRQQPDHLRSVVLDAVVPLTYNLFTEPAFAKERIAEKYFNDCAADARCNAAFPDLSERYLALIDRLNASPVTVTVVPQDALIITQSYQVKLTGSLLEDALYQSLYSNVRDLIPLIIDHADKGDYTFVSTAILPLVLLDDTMATGMYMTVACADRGDTDLSQVDYSSIYPRLANEERQDAEEGMALCQAWSIDLLPRDELSPVISNIPTLLLSGDFDPITPPQYAETLLPGLSQGKHVIFPGGSHGQAVSSPCANTMIASFLNNPRDELDTGCVDEPLSSFVTTADVVTVPSLRRSLANRGVMGLLWFGGSMAPGLLVGLLLLTAIPVYGIGWLINRLRRVAPPEESEGWTRAWSRWAPWLALAASIVLLAFVGLLGTVIGISMAGNQNLILLGAIPASWQWIFYLPLLFVVLTLLMGVTTVALWRGHHRSLPSRFYYTLLTLAALLAVAGLTTLGVLGL